MRPYQLLLLDIRYYIILHTGIIEDHVILERVAARCDDFKDLGGAGRGDHGVGGGHGRDDPLDHALSQPVGHALDPELLRPLLGLLEYPGDVLRVVSVNVDLVPEGLLLGPEQNAGVLDAVLGQPRRVGDGAQREVDLGREEVQRAVDTG